MSQTPTVLMIAYTYYQSDPRVMREAEAAVSGGFAVDFLALRRERDPTVEELGGVRVHHLRQARYRGRGHLRYLLSYLEFFLRCFFKCTMLFFSRRYRVIHVNNMPDFLVLCTVIPKLLGAKIVLDIHDPMPNTFASKFRSGERGFFFRLLLWQERLSAWYADRTLTVHEPVKAGVLVKHGLAPNAIQTICNFADEDVFQLQPGYVLQGKVRMVFHGTILERYGLKNLVLAISRMQFRERIEVKIIGEGDFSQALKELISQLGLEKTVEFDNHSYPVREMPRLLAGYNLGLVPMEISSITDYALPLKLLEYISLGLPAVTVRSAAITYYFNEEDCLFYQWDDLESLRQVLDRVAQQPELLLPYRQKAVELRQKFLWSKEKLKYIGLLKELSAPASAPLLQPSVVPARPTEHAGQTQTGTAPLLVSVVIVSWNAREYLRQCLNSLSSQTCCWPMEIIVVDNASSDGSPEMVAAEFPHVKLIRNEANLGFAKANNLGVAASHGRYLCLVNSDVKVLPQCLSRLVDYCEQHPEAGMVGPRIIGGDGQLQRSCRGFPTVWNMFCRALALDTFFPRCKLFTGYSLWHWPQDSLRPVGILSGCFWLVRRQSLEQVGLLDESFFMYGEDMDWCRRFWKGGWPVLFVPTAEAIHYGGASSANAPLRFYVERHRADLHYWRKHHSSPAVACYFLITSVHLVARALGYAAGLLLKRQPPQTCRYKMSRSLAALRLLLAELFRPALPRS